MPDSSFYSAQIVGIVSITFFIKMGDIKKHEILSSSGSGSGSGSKSKLKSKVKSQKSKLHSVPKKMSYFALQSPTK